jgi:hypothetical protein
MRKISESVMDVKQGVPRRNRYGRPVNSESSSNEGRVPSCRNFYYSIFAGRSWLFQINGETPFYCLIQILK